MVPAVLLGGAFDTLVHDRQGTAAGQELPVATDCLRAGKCYWSHMPSRIPVSENVPVGKSDGQPSKQRQLPMPWVHGDWVDDDESHERAPSRWAFDAYLREVFERAGWVPIPPPAPTANGDALLYAEALLSEFGGLTVGLTPEGVETAAGDIEFAAESHSAERYSTWNRYWPQLRTAAWVGIADRTYMGLFVAANGDFLAVTEMDEKLYNFGADFVRFVDTLLRRLPWPASVERST
jgi:hypothetical protein